MINDSNQSRSNAVSADLLSRPDLTGDTDLREQGLQLNEEEKAKVVAENPNLWFSSPLLIGLASALFGVVGTAVGAGLQGYSNFQLERQKFEFTLIQNALETKDTDEAAKRLQFLVKSGVITSLDSDRIQRLAENPEQLPNFPPAHTVGGGVR